MCVRPALQGLLQPGCTPVLRVRSTYFSHLLAAYSATVVQQ